MVKKISLNVSSRTAKNGSLRNIRDNGYVPGVVYGAGIKSESLKVKKAELKKAYEIAGESSLINLKIDDKDPVKVIIKEIQIEPVKHELLHVDFYKVNMRKALEVEIPLEFIGQSKAEHELGGTLIKGMETLKVKCLPGDLVEKIDVDVSALKTYDDSIKIKDLKIPEDYELIDDPESLVAHVIEPQAVTEEPTPAPESAEEPEKGAEESTPSEE